MKRGFRKRLLRLFVVLAALLPIDGIAEPVRVPWLNPGLSAIEFDFDAYHLEILPGGMAGISYGASGSPRPMSMPAGTYNPVNVLALARAISKEPPEKERVFVRVKTMAQGSYTGYLSYSSIHYLVLIALEKGSGEQMKIMLRNRPPFGVSLNDG